ncbi:MAG: ATP-dependent DNA helicase RecG [candidate division Zixibacteria bacterium]|nr:ATP-dependent DNA helicase RecG [candidate division Zixibacteria bacterium]
MVTTKVKTEKHLRVELKDSVQYLKGIGPERAKVLKSAGIETIEDLLYHIPRRYLDRSTILPMGQVKVGSVATVIGRVEAFGRARTRRPQFQVILKDNTGFIRLVWFSGLNWVKNVFEENDLVVASGQVTLYSGLQMVHPEFEIVSKKSEEGISEDELIHTGRVIPLYPSTAELKKFRLDSRGFRRVLKPLLDGVPSLVKESLPEKVTSDLKLPSFSESIRKIHFPDDLESAQRAKARLAFDELFYLELMLALRKKRIHREEGIVFQKPGDLVRGLLKILPFQLTDAQKKVLREISADMMSNVSMHRLLQGDVGSGKTIVALVAMLMAVESGYQSALMAPTEILAEQHFITIHQMLESLGVKVGLLTSSVTGAERNNVLQKIQNGEAQVVIGTHALIQEKVKFFKLGLVVIDEQHRFGVMQRAKLKRKGPSPDVLVMTATPIPRSLAMTVYGDLDVSVIDALPPGRKPIKTSLWTVQSSRQSTVDSRQKVYEFLEGELKGGHQAYIVYPLVEESEKADLKAATESYEFLKEEIFSHRRLALLHGRIKSKERESIMQAFRNRDYDILVATTVIEVGVDVPNATVMVIEHAERFGLSQLHQLRGRIGRGADQSFCLLVANPPLSQEAEKRLKTMTATNDGFKISEMDLKLRGPGEFFGTRQHGLPELKIADIVTDARLLYRARDWAFKIVGEDPKLTKNENLCIRSTFIRKYKKRFSLVDIG